MKRFLKVTTALFPLCFFPEIAHADPVTLVVAAATSGLTVGGSILAGTLTFGFSISSAIIGAGLAAVSSLLAPKQKPSGTFQIPDQGYTQQFRQAVAPRKIVYGECRVSGNILYIGTTNTNKYLHMVIELASHEVDKIGEIWINDYSIPEDHLDGDGTVNTGRYQNIVRIKKVLGTAAQAADSDLVSEVTEWTTSHKLSGIAYLYVRMQWDRDKFPSGIPNVSAWVRGKKIKDQRLDLNTNYLTYSDQFDNAAWTKNNSTIDENVVNSPISGTLADNLIENSDTSQNHFIEQSITTVSGNDYTLSIYAKEIDGSAQRYLLLRFPSSLFGGNYGANFDVGNGVINNSSVQITSSITSVGNGWYRCTISGTASASASNDILIGLVDNDTGISTIAYNGDGSSGITLFGAQLNDGDSVSSYIRTQGTSETITTQNIFTTNAALHAYDYLIDDLGLSVSDSLVDQDQLLSATNLSEEYVDVTTVNYNIIDVDTTNNILSIDGDRMNLVFGDKVQLASGIIGGLFTNRDYFVAPYQRSGELRIQLSESLGDLIDNQYISLTSGSTGVLQKVSEPRYASGGIIKTDTSKDENFKEILKSMAGQAVYAGGSWKIYGGEYQSPTISFDESDFASGIEISPKIGKKDRFNRIQGVYISPYNNDNPADYPLVKNSTYETNDGIVLKKDFDLGFVQRPHHAQRVAKIYLERSRQEIIFKAAFKLTAFKVQVGDNFYLSFDRFGWTNKVFEVLEWELSLNDGAPVINITARENASGVYDWNNGEETAIDFAPNTSLDSPFDVEVVTGFSLDSLLVSTQGADKIYNVKASWNEHGDQFVLSGGRFEIEFKETTDSVYKSAGKVDGNVTEMILPSLKPDVLYDIRIFAYNNLDIRSAATTINNFQVGTTVTTNTEDWENETLARNGDDWETDTLTTEDWE